MADLFKVFEIASGLLNAASLTQELVAVDPGIQILNSSHQSSTSRWDGELVQWVSDVINPSVYLKYPDTVLEADIQAVVDAHSPAKGTLEEDQETSERLNLEQLHVPRKEVKFDTEAEWSTGTLDSNTEVTDLGGGDFGIKLIEGPPGVFPVQGIWESPVLDSKIVDLDWGIFHSKSNVPAGTSISVGIRSDNDDTAILSKAYDEPIVNNSYPEVVGRYVQFRVTLNGPGTKTPDSSFMSLRYDQQAPIKVSV